MGKTYKDGRKPSLKGLKKRPPPIKGAVTGKTKPPQNLSKDWWEDIEDENFEKFERKK